MSRDKYSRYDGWSQLLDEVQKNIGGGCKDYADVLSWAFEVLGINYFSYVYMGYLPAESDDVGIVGNYPEEWVETYKSNALHKCDPVIRRSSYTSSSFFWDACKAEDASLFEVFELSSPYGIEQGFTVPIHEPGCAFGSMHFSSPNDNTDFKEIIRANSHLIHAISFLAHQHRPTSIRRQECQKISSREKECLRWVSLGKTYDEIGTILGISERTVKFHAGNVMEKLEVNNIKQALTKAVRLNWI
ncbi:helix-turn-helix transcriptional regulator [Litchfieldella rifensis]|uniref:Helix-turn-helix transcriptional regulator n=1 Tax=Litchfieldella rifensis TaxID=762643 RepID=A0ABV7LJ01_9GAMM